MAALALGALSLGAGCTMAEPETAQEPAAPKATVVDLAGVSQSLSLETVDTVSQIESRVELAGSRHVVRLVQEGASFRLQLEGNGLKIEVGTAEGGLAASWSSGAGRAEFVFADGSRAAELSELRDAVKAGRATSSDVARERELLPAAFAAVDAWPAGARSDFAKRALRAWAGRMITAGANNVAAAGAVRPAAFGGDCATSCSTSNSGSRCNVSCTGSGYFSSSCASCFSDGTVMSCTCESGPGTIWEEEMYAQ
jgi:hypothetical protein